LIRDSHVANPDDTLLSDDPAANLETPPPAPVEVQPATERSGSISISGGDFATPMVRKRTITKPRGLPVVPPPVDLAADVVTPPPVKNGTPAPEPRRLTGPVKQTQPRPVAAAAPETTLHGPPPMAPAAPETTLHGQASRLRGAQVTGVVAAEDVPVTPPPLPVLADGALPATPPPVPGKKVDVAPVTSELPSVEIDPGPTPPPEPVQAAEALPIVEEPPVVEEPPIVEPLPEPPLPEPPVVQEAAEASVDASSEATQGAIPSRPMHEGDSERNNLSPLAQTLAHIAEEAQRRSEAGEELASEEDLELVDAPLDPAPAAPTVRPVVPPLPVLPAMAYATPPPLPAILAKSSAPAVPVATDSAAGEITAPLLTLPQVPEALAERPRRPKRSKPWFEEIFDEDYLRTLPFMTPEQTMREVSFIEASLEATPGAEILDVGCGYGRHAIELVQKGLNVTGLDLSLPLLIRAADEAQRRALSVNFVHADMREMPFDQKFDGAYSMLTSFGYFDEDANLKVAEGVARALKPGGRFLLDIVNRDYVVADLPTRIWWEGVGCVVLEEVDFNFHTSRIVTRRSVVFEDGRQLEQEISVRAYSLHELGRLLRQAGFRVLDISGSTATRGRFLGVNSRNLLVLAEKRTD
jgi:SAM-dependent methyltransferase